MKIKNILTILMIISCSQVIKASEKQIWRAMDGLENYYLKKIHALNSDTLFIVGSDDKYSNEKGMIAKSTNGALTWQVTLTSTEGLLTDIIFIDENNGFAGGENGIIFKTTDKGETWQQKTTGTQVDINAIAISGTNNYWAVGNTGLVIHSDDAGETWNTIDIGTTQQLNDIAFRGNLGYIVGNGATIYKTEDSGENWNTETINTEGWKGSTEIVIENLLAVNITQNDVYVMNGREIRGYPLLLNRQQEWVVTDYDFACFHRFNDDVGYGVFVNMTTCGQPVLAIYKSDSYQWDYKIYGYSSAKFEIDINHADIYFPKEDVGYIVSGNLLLKTAPGLTSANEEIKIQSPELFYTQNKNTLKIFSNSILKKIEIINLSGDILFSENIYHNNELEIKIDHIKPAVYIIRGITSENKGFSTKWIKY